jgi:hypothetical protein
MNFYEFKAHDQRCQNWLLFVPSTEDPPLELKPRYVPYVCRACGKFEHNAIFEEGFDPNTKIQGRGDIIVTDDGFCCFNDKVKNLVQRLKIGGLRWKAVGRTGWYVMNAVLLVNADRSVYKSHKPYCNLCKRPDEVTGLFQFESEMQCPKVSRTFFSTIFDRQCSGNFDRDIFATGDIVALFKEASIKGGLFDRLFTPAEEAVIRKAIKTGVLRRPAKSRVYL